MRTKILILCGVALSSFICLQVAAQETITLSNENVEIRWKTEDGSWKLDKFGLVKGDCVSGFGQNSGTYGFIYSSRPSSDDPVTIVERGDTLDFPEDIFRYVKPDFLRATSEVPMNRIGEYVDFVPSTVYKKDDAVIFWERTPYGRYTASWSLDKVFGNDIIVDLQLVVDNAGYYSLASPTMATLTENELSWAVVPGFYQGAGLQESFPLGYAYAQGLPAYPVLCRESTLTSMVSIMTSSSGVTMGVIPEPGQDRNPYYYDKPTHATHWNIALSHMNSRSELTPTAYHPVVGQYGSYFEPGDTVGFRFRISLGDGDWYAMHRHVVYDIYDLPYSFELWENKRSLADRILKQYDYVLDDATALWNEEEYKGRKIMAQSYNSGVIGADNDAMKNSDIGAVWMLGKLTGDPLFTETRIPYIRNFKILQQSTDGFFKGAVEGQYYLSRSKRFTEEWGNHFEPVAITYYTMADLGNILLFEPDNEELKQLLRNGAERLMEWQLPDGSWEVAYDRTTHRPIYTDLRDFRPTFYGLIIAYQIFGDPEYLEAARRGADWFIENAVEKGQFLGVCGDVRFVNDFATIQSSAALLDMYEITGESKYFGAAVKTAEMYTTSIYTHPIPSREIKYRSGVAVEDWQLSQVGLGFEHGGSMGSAVPSGPILLASHCAYFIKLYGMTGDVLFRDLARLGALGKDSFVHEETGVASYYWMSFDAGSGPFPHHAWWQIGWIYDYLLAEAELRSEGKISFPRGFMTPKVGPHRTAGFEKGTINGKDAELIIRKGLVKIDNPNIDYLTALNKDAGTLYLILLNDQARANNFVYTVHRDTLLTAGGKVEGKGELEGFGYRIIEIGL